MVEEVHLPEWRNWQTRQVEGLVPVKGVQVQVLSPALYSVRTYGDEANLHFTASVHENRQGRYSIFSRLAQHMRYRQMGIAWITGQHILLTALGRE